MTVKSYGSRIDGRPANGPAEGAGARRVPHVPAGEPRAASTIAAVSGPDLAVAASRVPPFVRLDGWKPAHTEAARFVGECFAVGAVLGFVTELTRPVWEKRHA